MSGEAHRYNDCDCVPGHRCDCWDFRAADGTVAFEPGHFHRMLGQHLEVATLARAIHETKGGGPFGVEGSCECTDDAEAIAAAYVAKLERPLELSADQMAGNNVVRERKPGGPMTYRTVAGKPIERPND